MLKNTFADVHSNDGRGEKGKINKGSRQRRFLAPFLFNLCIKGCIEDFVNHDVRIRCKIGLIKYNVLAYADDDVV